MHWFWSLDETTRAALIGAAAALVTALIGVATALVTAVITLLSVGIGLYLNRKSQQEERRLTLRREVYLNAANRYAAATQVLSVVANPFVDVRTMATPIIGEFAAAIAQVQLVGDERAMRAAVALHHEFTKIYTDMIVRRMPLEQLRNRVDTNNARVAQLATFQPQTEQAAQTALEELRRLHDQTNELLRQIFEGQMELTREVLQELDGLASFAMEATFAVKEEFGIKVGQEAYMQFVAQSMQSVRESVQRSLADVERHAAQVNQPSAPTSQQPES